MTKFFHRSGKPASEAEVQRAKDNYAKGKRTGVIRGSKCTSFLTCSIQPRVADSIDAMTLTEFCRYSGAFTYKWSEK